MKTMFVLAALTFVGGVVAGCAANTSLPNQTETAYQGPGACVRTGPVINVNRTDDTTVYVATERGYVFRLDMPRGCPTSGFEGAFSSNAETCNGGQVRVSAGTINQRAMQVCMAQITGPYADSRETGLWSRTIAN